MMNVELNNYYMQYCDKMRKQLGKLGLAPDTVEAIIGISLNIHQQITESALSQQNTVRRAQGVSVELSWMTGSNDDPATCVTHIQRFPALEEAMRRYEEIKDRDDVWDALVRQVVAAQGRVKAYYSLMPLETSTRNVTQAE